MTRFTESTLEEAVNRAFYKMLTDSVDVEYRHPEVTLPGDKDCLVDFAHPDPKHNNFLADN